jgi:signal transduction histidine kinase
VILENNAVIDCNVLALEIYELTREEMVGKNILKLSNHDGTENTFETSLAMAYVGLDSQAVECLFTLHNPMKRKKVLEMSISAFGNESNKLMVMMRDITKTIEDEKVFRMQARQAQMGEMVSMIAHQWRQPLSIINAVSANLKFQEQLKDNTDANLVQELETIEQQTVHLSQTISDFRDFFRPDKPKERVQLSEIILHAMKLVEESFKNNSIKYELIIQSDSEVMTFRNEILQVIMTMFKNTIDAFMGSNIETRFIEVILSNEGQNAIISIQDNAGGIDSEIIDQIFLPYFTTKHSSTGTGLGLYMSKMVIEEHCEGVLEVKSENDTTIFRIKLGLDES